MTECAGIKVEKIPPFQERIDELNRMIADANRIVFFTGAGISTGSGIPDFRSADGLYSISKEADPEYLLSDGCLVTEPEKFFDYLRSSMDFRAAEPNVAHLKIAELQRAKEVSVITQNIDGLHEKSHGDKVYTIHGTMGHFYCSHCFYDLYDPVDVLDGNFDNLDGVPKCPICGEGTIRPDIVLYGEGMNASAWDNALKAAAACDLIIVVGTSLKVYPAAYIPMNCYNKKMVIINREPTHMDYSANLVFREDIKDVFSEIKIP